MENHQSWAPISCDISYLSERIDPTFIFFLTSPSAINFSKEGKFSLEPMHRAQLKECMKLLATCLCSQCQYCRNGNLIREWKYNLSVALGKLFFSSFAICSALLLLFGGRHCRRGKRRCGSTRAVLEHPTDGCGLAEVGKVPARTPAHQQSR